MLEDNYASPAEIVESIGMIRILDESLLKMQTLLEQMEEIARQSASDIEGGDRTRAKLQEQIEQLKIEIDTIVKRLDLNI